MGKMLLSPPPLLPPPTVADVERRGEEVAGTALAGCDPLTVSFEAVAAARDLALCVPPVTSASSDSISLSASSALMAAEPFGADRPSRPTEARSLSSFSLSALKCAFSSFNEVRVAFAFSSDVESSPFDTRSVAN